MTKLIRQRTPSDCAMCSVAMLLGKTYDEVWEATPEKYHKALIGPGMGVDGAFELDLCDFFGFEGYWRSHIYPNKPAILTVRSLTKEGTSHAIYYDGGSILDPQNGVEDKPFYRGDHIPAFTHAFQLEERIE